MFVRKKPNPSGSVSVQVIDKSNGYCVVKTIGTTRDPQEVQRLVELGRLFIAGHSGQYSLFPADERANAAVLDFVQTLHNTSIRTVGPELVFGRLFDEIGFGVIPEPLFRDIVIARLVYPASKLKTADYLLRYRGKSVSAQSIYRFLDRLNEHYSRQAQEAAYPHSRTILRRIQVVMYDMTSLYFEAEDEDDLRSRPMYHRRRRRIEAHVLVACVAYSIYEELERRLHIAKIPISPQRAADLTQTMYEMTFRLPNDPQECRALLQMDEEQQSYMTSSRDWVSQC